MPQGRVAEGIALYERALALHPQYADALYNLGVAFGESGQQDKALFMYEMAAHFNPQVGPTGSWLALGWVRDAVPFGPLSSLQC